MSACMRVHMQVSVLMLCVLMLVLYRNIQTLSVNSNTQVELEFLLV